VNVDIDHTIDVGGFAAIINSRLAAESRISKAIGFGWICAGIAIAGCLIALGFASAFCGYSYMLSIKPAAEQTAKALAQALKHANLKMNVSGTMSLSPRSELKLAPGQTVKLDENATVRLDPNSSVRVIGDLRLDVPQPSKRQLQLDTTTRNEELPFTNYTAFRGVSYGSGEVVTGWNYDLEDTTKPKSQFCYYRQLLDKGVSAKYILAIDASPRRPSPLAKPSFDFDGALRNCIWFSGA
jgi:hypothetical protein